MGKIFAERAAEQDLAAWIKKDILREGGFDKKQKEIKTFKSKHEQLVEHNRKVVEEYLAKRAKDITPENGDDNE